MLGYLLSSLLRAYLYLMVASSACSSASVSLSLLSESMSIGAGMRGARAVDGRHDGPAHVLALPQLLQELSRRLLVAFM